MESTPNFQITMAVFRCQVLVLWCMVLPICIHLVCGLSIRSFKPTHLSQLGSDPHDVFKYCKEEWRNTTLDHFSFPQVRAQLQGNA